jgi:hypothetical protein
MTIPSSRDATDLSGPLPPPAVVVVSGEVGGSVPQDDGREELREFFAAIDGFGARARRQYHRIVPARVRSRRGLLVICCVLTFGGLVYKSSSRRPPAEMPIELQGAWVTTTKSYADRGFWIGKHQVAFRVGPNPDEIEVYPVTHIDMTSLRGDTTTYDIEYAVDGGRSRWSIRHSGLPQPAIVFVHQPQMTWTVTPDLHPPVR